MVNTYTHKHNFVTINNRGDINITLAEIIEGGGIESTLTQLIKDFFERGE
jgi:hypothetical protein